VKKRRQEEKGIYWSEGGAVGRRGRKREEIKNRKVKVEATGFGVRINRSALAQYAIIH